MNTDLFFNNAGDERGTPQELFDRLHETYKFDLDVAANEANHKCDLWLGDGGLVNDGLDFDWNGFRSFMNPPYSTIYAWVNKASSIGKTGGLVVGVLPVRSDTKWWHQFVWDRSFQRPYEQVTLLDFIPGRLTFELHVTEEQRAIIRDLEGNMEMKEIIDLTALPKMAIEGIWQGKPDDELLSSAPFPSCVVVWGKP
jgi:phage N-6-adenine-methyltransferase